MTPEQKQALDSLSTALSGVHAKGLKIFAGTNSYNSLVILDKALDIVAWVRPDDEGEEWVVMENV